MTSTPIRTLTSADWQAFQRLRLEGLRECPEAFTASYETEQRYSEAIIKQRLLSNIVFGYFQNGVLCGLVGLNMHPDQPNLVHRGYIWGLYVNAEARGSGAGRKLMQAVIECAQEKKMEVLDLGVATTNTSALKLYQSLGFESYGIQKHALKVNGRYVDEIQMAKPLSKD